MVSVTVFDRTVDYGVGLGLGDGLGLGEGLGPGPNLASM